MLVWYKLGQGQIVHQETLSLAEEKKKKQQKDSDSCILVVFDTFESQSQNKPWRLNFFHAKYQN